MGHWLKADFDAAYSKQVERRFRPPRNTPTPMRLHYHEWAIKPLMDARWTELLKVISPPILASERILIVGAGFGWGVRSLLERVNCTAIGTDISSYIQDEKGHDDSAEIAAAVTAAGLDPTTGRGLELLGLVSTTGNRAKEIVLDEDLTTAASRTAIESNLGGTPTRIFAEDIVDDSMTDAEIQKLANDFDSWASRKSWLYTQTLARSSEALNTLTGHQVIEFGTYRIVG